MNTVDRGISHSTDQSTNLLICTGIGRSGKTSTLQMARSNGVIPPTVRGLEMGNTLARRLRQSGVQLSTKDTIRTLPPEIVDTQIKQLVTETLTRPQGNAIIVCHLVYEQNNQFHNLVDHYAEFGENVRGVLVFLAYPQEVIDRYRHGYRRRAAPTLSSVTRHQEELLSAAVSLATKLRVEARPIMSRPKQDPITLFQISEAVDELDGR